MRLFKARNYIFCLLILLFVSTTVKSQTPAEENYFSVQNRLRFGNYLFSEKDYLRAVDEFREYLKKENNDTIQFKVAECFLRINRFDEASANYKTLFFHSPLSDNARLGFYKSLFFKNDFPLLKEFADNKDYLPESFEEEVQRLKYISYFLDNSTLPDTNKFIQYFPDSNRADISEFYLMKQYPPKKNPTKAALLSAVVPGLGKIYTEQIGDGITAFITTGLLTFLSINNFNHDHNFRGWLFAGLTAFSYAGNIYGSAASAHVYNAGIKLSFDKEIKLYFEKRNYFLPNNDWLK